MRWGKLSLENNLVMAPMAGWTDLPFRLMVRNHGAALVYTEMISAVGLSRGEEKTWALLRTQERERPLAVQLFGAEPESLARAASLVEEAGYDAVDLNLGCPARKVAKNGAGAILLRKPDLIRTIFARVRAATSLTLTAKLRSGWSREEGFVAPEIARAAREEGLDGLAFHPRYGRQGFGGKADYEDLARVVEAVDLPVIGSGDVTGPESAQRMLATGCAGVMIGRAALGDPWIFARILAAREGREFSGPGPEEVRATVLGHLALMVEHYGELPAARMFKGWAGRYLKGLPGAKVCREAVNTSHGLEEIREILDTFFGSLAGAGPRRSGPDGGEKRMESQR